MKKITLTEFLQLRKAVIHCRTKENYYRLAEEFHRLGKKWSSGKSYVDTHSDLWDIYGEGTCLSSNGEYSDISYYMEAGYDIFEFENVFSLPLSLLDIIGKENPV